MNAEPPPIWNCRISSNLTYLQALHDEYGWIPGADHVRSPPDVKAARDTFTAALIERHDTPRAAILSEIFGDGRGAGGGEEVCGGGGGGGG